MPQQKLDRLKKEMEKTRKQLYDALDEAMGDLADPKVQKHAHRFDVLLTEYVQSTRARDILK